MIEKKEMQIPKEYQQLCKDIAKVLRKFNVENGWMGENPTEKTIYRFSGKLSISDSDMSDINFSWEDGRHGDGQNNITINTELRVTTKLDED